MDRQEQTRGASAARGEPAARQPASRSAAWSVDGPAAQRRMAEGIHHSPRAAAQRRVIAAATGPTRSGSTGGVAQREVVHDGTTYSGNGERAGWRALLKREVVKEYNTRTGKSLAGDANLADEDLDRCHKISFNDIEAIVVSYLNGSTSQSDFINLTDSLKAPQQYKEVGKWRTFLANDLSTGASATDVCAHANKLLSILNSSLFNVILGAASTNRSIQEKLDLHFHQNSSGDYSLTPLSRSLATTWTGHTSGVPYSPGGTTIKSSSSGSVPYGNLTPTTKGLIDNL